MGHQLILASFVSLGAVVWQHLALSGHRATSLPAFLAAHAPSLALDLMLAMPFAGLAVWAAAALGSRVGGLEPIARGCAFAVGFTLLYVPVAMAQALGHLVLDTGQHHHGADDLAGLAGYGLSQALQTQPVVLLLAVLGAALTAVPVPDLGRAVRVRLRAAVPALVCLVMLAAALVALPGQATAAALVGGCGTAPERTFHVSAIDVDITLNRFGDHDPFGYMYALTSKVPDLRAEEAALKAASALPLNAPGAAKVSIGLKQDVIQPLVLRARLGECVVIMLKNEITQAPRGGPNGNPSIVQPGGAPSVSIDMQGVSYDAVGGFGGQIVGTNTLSGTAVPGSTRQYKFFLDPLLGEGTKVFRSGGDSTQLTAHGLFGALIAEPAGARWYDPITGAEKTNDLNWSNWEAMVQPAGGPAFREFGIIYHEVGDENYNVRRPLRENAEGTPVGDQVEFGRPVPMIDTGAPNPAVPTAGGGGTNSYRPSSRALNYRSESFWRRLQLLAARGLDVQKANESLTYSSYSNGDPATPIPRSYLGEPTKTRLVHAGFEQLHVHHLHGGATRWRLNPGADNTDMAGGLKKNPIQNATSIRLDSQTISPQESYNLEHECGAGGCQQAAGDFLYHCHIAHHYIAGMWGMWRVLDTRQADLATLPGRQAAPTAVNSSGLIGKTMPDGKTVVLQANLTNPATQVALEALVEGQLPPQGARWNTGTGEDPDDATVWDWQKAGTPTAPVYQGEPETTSQWANYVSPTPGARPEILFNPINGRPAYPMLKPHLGIRPPFSPNGHSGTPYLGDTATSGRPDGLCPQSSPIRTYDITAIPIEIQETVRERDGDGEIFVLNEDKNAVLSGSKPPEPLTIRSNVSDCVAVTLSSELDPAVQQKINMHTHFVQFDPRASDGVITGYAYEQSIFSTARENRTLTTVNSPTTITVSTVGKIRPGVFIGIGVGRASIEIRKITAISGNVLTLDSALTKTHAAGEPVTVEFVQYRWYSDVDSGTVFWHDHVNGIESWAHGLFGAHIIEPKNSTYHDPVTGAQVRSGTIVDIVNTGGSVGVGQSGSFREFMIYLHNGRRGRLEVAGDNRNFGQECEEGSINLRAAPLGERTPPGATPADPATTDQRQEYNGQRCRNAFRNDGDIAGNPNNNTTRATVTSVDPNVFSSVKYGEPMTPLLRAYVGDPVVIRTIGLNERAEALRIQGHRFRMERFNAAGQLTDAATTGISERFDYVLDGGAGGTGGMSGDFLYYSTRTFALESGAWGLFRVHDTLQSNLRVLPGRAAPPGGAGFPKLSAATGNTQQNPGPNPLPAFNPNGTPNTTAVSQTKNPCPSGARALGYDVSIFNQTLPTAPFPDTSGVIYSLTSDKTAIQAGTKRVEPLVLRANEGDCVTVTLRNQITPGSLYGGTRAGFDLAKLPHNQQLSTGAAVGLNADSSVAAGQTGTYTFYADKQLGTSIFQNLANVGSIRHGAYGLLIVEPKNSTWSNSADNAPLGTAATSAQAIIRVPNGPKFREFALTMHTTDQQYARSIVPYIDWVAGIGVNSVTAANIPTPPVEGAPPGTANNPGSLDKAFNHLSYHSAPLTVRLGLTANPSRPDLVTLVAPHDRAFSSVVFGDPDTQVAKAFVGDPVVFRLGVAASDQFHTFTIGGHMYPLEPNMWTDASDHRSQLLTSRTITAGEVIDAEVVGGAGGPQNYAGDYLYGDGRQPFAQAGMWGIFRVQPTGSAGIAPL